MNRVLLVADGRIELFRGTFEEFDCRGAAPANESDRRDQLLLLETRLAQLGAALAAPPLGEAERLNAEFIRVSRTLRALQDAGSGDSVKIDRKS